MNKQNKNFAHGRTACCVNWSTQKKNSEMYADLFHRCIARGSRPLNRFMKLNSSKEGNSISPSAERSKVCVKCLFFIFLALV
ncbi:hypothetical protein KP509_06G038600 [Ceratopteris richardii]|uniref:Uncharacterized protein n=1 Tax=Ceratopteris richardii TaxID=49495 RepID=A0A8T2UMX1_CERRI|nr:hypothetical protein KP509_06G038600 [Ceratopteris richardii]